MQPVPFPQELYTAISRMRDQAKDLSFASKLEIPIADVSLCIDDQVFQPPFMPKKLKQIFGLASPACFGKGSDTLYDKTVRDTFEIKSDRLRVDGQQWRAALDTALPPLLAKLGLNEQSGVKIELYNLLIYEKGQFFKPHQDSEKADGMIASLVIVLPTRSSGGSLLVYHQGQTKTLSPDWFSPGDTADVYAFYADCHHEVRPVRSGYRLALTYNVFARQAEIVTESQQPSILTLSLSDYFSAVEKRSEKYTRPVPPYLVYFLDHQYTQKSLSWSEVKGRDRLALAEFMAAEEDLQLDMSLALIDVKQTWDTDAGPDDVFDDLDYDEELDDEERMYCKGVYSHKRKRKKKTPQPTDLIHEEFEILHCLNRQDSKVEGVDFKIHSESVMELLKTESLKPHQSEFEGWMGNSGNTMDRWYHRAALILWRKSDARFFQLSMDLKVALHGLVADFPARPKQIQNEVQRLMPWLNERAAGSEHVMEFVELAMVLDEPALARDLLVPMLATMISSQKFSLLEGLVGKYGDDWLKQFFDTSNNSGKDSWAARQALHESAASLDHWYRKFPGLGPVLLGSLLETSYRRWKSADESSRRTVLENRKTAFPMIRILLKSLLAEPDIERRFASKLVDEILKRKNLFAAAETAQILLDSLQGQSISLSSAPESFKCLVKVMKERLLMDTSIARDEGDWSIHEQPHCDCDDCQLLRDFLQNSKARSTFLPINAERRQHIHQMIDALAIPVTHQTRREGSPYKLVLNKKEELFAQFSKGKAMARQALDSLEGLQ